MSTVIGTHDIKELEELATIRKFRTTAAVLHQQPKITGQKLQRIVSV